jgi:hypothetical protein
MGHILLPVVLITIGLIILIKAAPSAYRRGGKNIGLPSSLAWP